MLEKGEAKSSFFHSWEYVFIAGIMPEGVKSRNQHI